MLTRRNLLVSAGLGLLPVHTAFAEPTPIAGKLVVTGFRGVLPGDPDVDAVRRLLEAGDIAGVILLRRNVVSPEQLIKLAISLRQAAGSFVPIISVDQEGGAIARLEPGNGFSEWMSAAEAAFVLKSENDLFDYYFTRATEMAGAGINVNFGPVLDLNLNPVNPIIGRLDRAFGRDPEDVVRCASAFVRAHRAAGVMTCGKHFPGHGSSVTDSHVEPTDVNATWVEDELVPFRVMAESRLLDSVMTAHLLHGWFSDGDRTPSSLSKQALKRLEQDIGFHGPVFTDDMQMKAVAGVFSEGDAAIAAVAAGNTFLIHANHSREHDIGTAERINQSVTEAIADGRIPANVWQQRNRKAAAFMGKLG